MDCQNNGLGEAIRAARIRKHYTQEQFAELLDVTPAHLKHMESGRRNPSVPLLFQIMRLLDLSVDAIVFPECQSAAVIHTDGLSPEETEALVHLIDTIKVKK